MQRHTGPNAGISGAAESVLTLATSLPAPRQRGGLRSRTKAASRLQDGAIVTTPRGFLVDRQYPSLCFAAQHTTKLHSPGGQQSQRRKWYCVMSVLGVEVKE